MIKIYLFLAAVYGVAAAVAQLRQFGTKRVGAAIAITFVVNGLLWPLVTFLYLWGFQKKNRIVVIPKIGEDARSSDLQDTYYN